MRYVLPTLFSIAKCKNYNAQLLKPRSFFTVQVPGIYKLNNVWLGERLVSITRL